MEISLLYRSLLCLSGGQWVTPGRCSDPVPYITGSVEVPRPTYRPDRYPSSLVALGVGRQTLRIPLIPTP
eukprot:scaffold5169_cov172-Amphora_coffeaeformis.AAC.10